MACIAELVTAIALLEAIAHARQRDWPPILSEHLMMDSGISTTQHARVAQHGTRQRFYVSVRGRVTTGLPTCGSRHTRHSNVPHVTDSRQRHRHAFLPEPPPDMRRFIITRRAAEYRMENRSQVFAYPFVKHSVSEKILREFPVLAQLCLSAAWRAPHNLPVSYVPHAPSGHLSDSLTETEQY